MIPRGLLLVVIINIIGAESQLIFPRNVSRKPRMNSNKITDVDTSCTKDSMDVRVRMERPFKGVVFTKDFARECRSQGNMETSVTLHLPPNACGVRVGSRKNGNSTENDVEEYVDEGLFYIVTIVIQMDKFLQQSSDQERVIKCWLKPKAMQIRSYLIEEMIEEKIKEITKVPSEIKNHRSGRMGNEWKDMSEEQQSSIMEQARAWMEILPSNGNVEATTVEVGEPTMLLIKSTLPAGVGLRITDCLAHDGLGESSQTLLDETGCPVDELIFPKMKTYHHTPSRQQKAKRTTFDNHRMDDEELQEQKNNQSNAFQHIMSYKHASTIFSAFKFPDRARLHLTCGLELCKGECPTVDCNRNELMPKSKDALLRRVRLDKGSDGLVIDRLQVYNSIEVLAPNIELENDASIRGSRQSIGLSRNDIDNMLSTSIPGDKTVCMSPSKMALAFCVLGLVFLSALVVAFISLIRARRKYGADRFGGPLSFYTGSKSIFSGSGSSNSGFSGSKLLLTDSPYLEHQSTSSNWPYGRVL